MTIEVMDAEVQVLGGGRFGTDVDGYRSMLEVVRRWPDRVWAIGGCSGIGRHVEMRLLAASSRPRPLRSGSLGQAAEGQRRPDSVQQALDLNSAADLDALPFELVLELAAE